MFLVPRPAPLAPRERHEEAAQRPISCKAGRQQSRREPPWAAPPRPAARGATLVGPELPGKI
jgi:hypothetical protein